ncbi:MAG: hypothetical protein AAF628_21360 [Planctomycetota bacterium]
MPRPSTLALLAFLGTSCGGTFTISTQPPTMPAITADTAAQPSPLASEVRTATFGVG